MDLSSEPKPAIETKHTEECSGSFNMNVLPAFNGNNEMPEISSGNNEPEVEHPENKMNEGKLYCRVVSNSIEYTDCEDKENKINLAKKLKTEDKNDCERESFEDVAGVHLSKKEVSMKEKEMLGVENDFKQQINIQDDVSSDGSNVSSIETNSSGIITDFESHENCNEEANEVSENSASWGKEEKINLKNNEDNILGEDDGVVSTRNNVALFDQIKFPYKNPSTAFDVVVPLIGKNVMSFGHIKPFPYRYDLAREMNRLKAIEEAPYLPKLSYHEWRKQRDARPQEEKDREERYEKYEAIKHAAYAIQVSIFILQELEKDDPDEGIIERCFIRFLQAPISNLSLVLSSHFIHVMMYIRGSSYFSRRLRYVADECYRRCHVMFPIPDGYNFETVYTSECVKNLPDELNEMKNYSLDYDDFEDPAS